MTEYEEPDDVTPVPEGRMPLRIATQLAAVGALLGGLEGTVVAYRSQLWLTPMERVELTLGAVVADAFVALGFGLVGGLLAWRMRGWTPLWRRYQRGFGTGWTLFAAFYLVPMAVDLWHRGDTKNTIGVSAVLTSVSIFGFLLAGFAYRRELIGLAPRIGFRLPAWLFAGLFAMLSGVVPQQEHPTAMAAPPHAANVILITVDTLRRDALGVYGSTTLTPNIDKLGLEGGIFDGAVTPLPETAPSHSAMFTGRHPSETHVVQNGRSLARAEQTVTEQLRTSGWHTGAFVSSFALDSSVGLDQGFDVYDDDFSPSFRGLSEFRTGWLGLRLLLRFGNPADWPTLLERRGDATVARALAWVDSVPAEQPLFLWVHLFDPHAPYDTHDDASASFTVDHRAILAQEPGYAYDDVGVAALRRQYAAEVHYTDTQVGVLLDGLRAAGRLGDAAVLLVGDHGESLGEHSIYFNHHGLYDEVLRVPMLLWESNPGWAPGTRNPDQVTVLDVANTLVEYTGVPKLGQTHSQALQDRLAGAVQPGPPLFLLGRTDTSWLYGIRAPQGVKYIESDEGAQEVYDLTIDPHEADNLVLRQSAWAATGHAGVAELRAHVEHSPPADGATADMLGALGYVDPGQSTATFPRQPPPSGVPAPPP